MLTETSTPVKEVVPVPVVEPEQTGKEDVPEHVVEQDPEQTAAAQKVKDEVPDQKSTPADEVKRGRGRPKKIKEEA
jgi:hypothetical protein